MRSAAWGELLSFQFPPRFPALERDLLSIIGRSNIALPYRGIAFGNNGIVMSCAKSRKRL